MTVYKFHGVVGDYFVPVEFASVMAAPEHASREDILNFYGWLRSIELRELKRAAKKEKKRIEKNIDKWQAHDIHKSDHLSCASARAAHNGSSSTPSGDSIVMCDGGPTVDIHLGGIATGVKL